MNVGDVVRPPEFQAVLIIEFDDGRMFPLVDDESPKCLLPIANRRLLIFQLDMLAKSGLREVYIVAPADYKFAMDKVLSDSSLSDYKIRQNMTIERIYVENKFDSCEALRVVSDRIRGDFVCINSDVFSKFSLGDMANFHRTRSSDLTMMLVAAPMDEPEKKGGLKKLRVEEEDQEFVGICEDGRVVLKLAVTDAEEAVDISKPLLHRCGTLALRTDLLDLGIYFISRWVLEFILENRHFDSLKTDVLPYFVDRQFQPVNYLLETFPSLQQRVRYISSLEPWLTSTTSYLVASDGLQFELIDSLGRDLLDAASVDMINLSNVSSRPSSPRHEPSLNTLSSLVRTDSLGSSSISLHRLGGREADGINEATAMGLGTGLGGALGLASPASGLMRIERSASGGKTTTGSGSNSASGRSGRMLNAHPPPDLLRCYAFVVDGGSSVSGAGSATTATGGLADTSASGQGQSEPLLLQRVTNIASYMTLNRDITNHTHSAATPWPRIQGFRKKEQSVVGENTVIGMAATAVGSGATADAATAGGGAAAGTGAGSAASEQPAAAAGTKAAKGAGGEESVTLKSSTIGHGCSVGARSKINNSIIMDNVTIGEK